MPKPSRNRAERTLDRAVEDAVPVARELLVKTGRRPPRDAVGVLDAFTQTFGGQRTALPVARASDALARARRENLALLVHLAHGIAPLARRLEHRSHATLWRWLNGPRLRMSTRTAQKIARTLSLPDGWLDRPGRTLESARREIGDRLVSPK
jgi:hypothetical protein